MNGGRRSWPRLVFSRTLDDGRRGDQDRFRRDVVPHLESAYNYARYLARDASASEDIVQNAFERALRSIDQCRGDVRPWLLAIVRNCFLDWRQTQARHDHVQLADEVAAQPSADGALDAIGIRETVERLPEPFREALVLRELEELTYREIADATGTPIGTVMSRLARARRMLASLLLDEPQDVNQPRRVTDR